MSDDYVRVCPDDEIAEGAIISRQVSGKPILLTRYQGTIYALDDICTHDGGDLSDGDLVDGQVQCPRHGARFDLKSGDVTRMPAVIGIETYKVKVENGDIMVAVSE